MLDTKKWLRKIIISGIIGIIILAGILYKWGLDWGILWGYCIGQVSMAGIAHFFFLPIRKGLEYNNSRLATKGYWIRRYLLSYGVLLILLVGVFETKVLLGVGALIGLLVCKFAIIWGALSEALNKEKNHG